MCKFVVPPYFVGELNILPQGFPLLKNYLVNYAKHILVVPKFHELDITEIILYFQQLILIYCCRIS